MRNFLLSCVACPLFVVAAPAGAASANQQAESAAALQLWLQSRVQIANINLHLARVMEGPPVASHQSASIEALREAIGHFSRNGTPEQTAAARNTLGAALLDRSEACPLEERNGFLAEAEKEFLEALKVFTRESHPLGFAMVSNNLGIALQRQSQWPFDQAESTEHALLDRARLHYNEALATYEKDGQTGQAALMGMNIAFLEIARQGTLPAERKAALEKSARTLEGILESHPAQATAQVKMNLAICLMELAEIEPDQRPERTAKALSLLEGLQGVRSSNPRAWARVESLLGQAHLAASLCENGGKWGHLRESARAYREVLTVFTRETFPADWAGNNARLGMVLAIQSQDPSLTEEEGGRILRTGLVSIIESVGFLTSNQTLRQEGNDLIEALKEPRAGGASPSTPSPTPPSEEKTAAEKET